MKNRNAYEGIEVENLFKDSIIKQTEIIKKLQNHFSIKSDLDNIIVVGTKGKKADVKMNFKCGQQIDVSVKSFKIAFNQMTRATVSNFCNKFGLSEDYCEELEGFVVEKSKKSGNDLFPQESRVKWGKVFSDKTKEIVKWGFSNNSKREIFVLYDKKTSIMRIYLMEDVLKNITTNITFTRGGINIGDCLSFQRKGGDGSSSKKHHRNSIQHPGNNIQLKIKANKFIKEFSGKELAEYKPH
ncbi:MAG: hypothetical protein FWD34_05545 [Oscillospiraceae bacterium]|nr:hypothetical protein [Oscillospiraceae bacterium]